MLALSNPDVNLSNPDIASPGCEFQSHAPFSNLVSALKFMQMNCACVNGWSCTHEPYNVFIQALSKVSYRC